MYILGVGYVFGWVVVGGLMGRLEGWVGVGGWVEI